MKKLFEFNTKTIVATGIGAALFTLLFMYVKIPTGIPETQIQTAYGVGGFFAATFGPIAGFLIAALAAFWIVVMDYSRTEYFEYEDDEYYYYVRAVPKISVTPRQLRIREIIPKGGEKKERTAEEDEIEEALKVLDSETAAEEARETGRIQIRYTGEPEETEAPKTEAGGLKGLFGRRGGSRKKDRKGGSGPQEPR